MVECLHWGRYARSILPFNPFHNLCVIQFYSFYTCEHVTLPPPFKIRKQAQECQAPLLWPHSQEEEGSELKPGLIPNHGFVLSSAYGTSNTVTLTDPVLTSGQRGGRRLVTVQEFRQKRPHKWSFLSSFLTTLTNWGSNPWPLHCKQGVLTTGPPRKSQAVFPN